MFNRILNISLENQTSALIIQISGLLKPLMTNVPRHIEISQLICNANQLTGFNMIGKIAR